jgi:rare lipoprotein A
MQADPRFAIRSDGRLMPVRAANTKKSPRPRRSRARPPEQTAVSAESANKAPAPVAIVTEQRCDIAPLPNQNHHISAPFGRSNARDLIQRLEAAVAAFPSHPSKQRQPEKARGKPKTRKLFKTIMWLRKKIGHLVLLVLCGSLLSAAPPQDVSTENSLERVQAGAWVIASMYWQDKLTSTGKAFKPVGLYAAHKTLPIGTLIRVSNPKNHRSINITINDRGPFIPGRDLDLTLGAGALLGFEGLGPLYMEVLALPGGEKPKRPLVENLYAGSDSKPIDLPEALKAMASAAEAERVDKAEKTDKAKASEKAEKNEKTKKAEKVAKAEEAKCRKGRKCGKR